MTTALVARDIDLISEALGDEGINYWATLVAMKPQRIRRMLLDGVCDSEAYHQDPFRFVRNDLVDSQKFRSTLQNSSYLTPQCFLLLGAHSLF